MKNLYLFLVLAFLSVISSSYANKPNPPAANALVFPVLGKKSNIGSVWGDERDGGKRKHEGIDIFATKGTPVVAVCDGVITSVGYDELGGKIVYLQADEYSWNAYYAHLDQQKVHVGQVVRKGQVLGTVGNTGNARTTPAHLHFGIYTRNGAVDPLPYVKNSPKLTTASEPVPESEQRRAEPTIAKSSGTRKTKVPAGIRTAAASILAGIFQRKVKGVLSPIR